MPDLVPGLVKGRDDSPVSPDVCGVSFRLLVRVPGPDRGALTDVRLLIVTSRRLGSDISPRTWMSEILRLRIFVSDVHYDDTNQTLHFSSLSLSLFIHFHF